MREYELAVVYDLAVAEAGGPEASVELLTHSVEARGGKVIRVDHWGRRRMAYPIQRNIDGDYVISRIELDPGAVAPLEANLGIDEKVYRHLIVRADELPVPPPPREPRAPMASAEAPAAPAAAAETPAAAAETPAAVAEAPAVEPEASETEVVLAPAPAESVAEAAVEAEAAIETAEAVETAELAEEAITEPDPDGEQPTA